MSSTDNRLGEFRLEHVLGRGGMGEVWRGVHVAQQTPVALKVVTAEKAREEKFHDAFRREVQSMAQLNHPGIAVVLDYGRVTEAVSEWTSGRLAPDAPYLAMELAEDSLDRLPNLLLEWEQVRDALDQLLDALAHAHARRVIHRDLKPQNVLVQFGPGGRVRYKLADFGLAHPLDDHHTETTSSGTPKYMAPEQILGDFREQGPWTDLYAIGCIAHWMVTRRTPFDFPDSEAVLRGHLLEQPPPLQPRLDVPRGFAGWLDRLLVKDPLDRFRRAADARWQLLQLDQRELITATGGADPPMPELRDSAATILDAEPPDTGPAREAPTNLREIDETVLTPAADSDSSIVSRRILRRARSEFRALHEQPTISEREPQAPPMPTSWRRDATPPTSMALVGAGLSLYGLRPVPIVDRDEERTAVWDALRAVAEDQTPRAVVLRGLSGAGKSRIAEWMGERAEEFGAARMLRAVHSPMENVADGLGRMVANYLRLVGLPREQVIRRLQEFMSPDGRGRQFDAMSVVALADLTEPEGKWQQNASPPERHAVLQRFLERSAWDRPLFVWLDDVQWGHDAIEFAASVLQSATIPVLFVLTVRDDVIADAPRERIALRQLLERDAATDVRVDPLSAEDHLELIRNMLRLDDAVAEQVAERTEGNPLFAVQLVGDWVERGLLEVGDSGFVVVDEDAIVLPDSIHNLWSRRILRALARYANRTTAIGSTDPALAERSLHAAAALGQEVETTEWAKACAQLGVDAPLRLVEELVNLRLAQRTTSGFRFTHGMLRESLLRRADEGTALPRVHAACAEMLQTHQPGPTSALRRARHWIAARKQEHALQPMLVAAEQAARRGDFDAALALDLERDELLDELGIAESDARRVHGWLRHARTLLLVAEFDEAEFVIARAETAAEASGDPGSLADVLQTRGTQARYLNETERGHDLTVEALEIYRHLDDPVALARCLKKLGEFQRRLGNPAVSVKRYEEAIDCLDGLDEPFELAWAYLGLGTSERQMRRLDRCGPHIRRALEIFRELGSGVGIRNSHNELGELERTLGNYDVAEAHYREVIANWQQQRHAESNLIRYNVAMTMLPRGRWHEAIEIVEDVLEFAVDRGSKALRMFCHAALAAAFAGLGDFTTAAEHFEPFRELSDQLPIYEPDIADSMLLLGTLALEGAPELARPALQYARDQHAKLGNDEGEQSVQELLDSLV